MTTDAATLADWLLARIAEDEAVANEAKRDFYSIEGGGLCYGETGYNTLPDLTIDPARVLAECEAKREIVRVHLSNPTSWQSEVAVRAIAAIYADRPGYREEWRP